MMNSEERNNVLKAAGIDTGKFVAMDVPEGATIIIATPDGCQRKYDRNGNPIDDLLKKVKDVGYIKEDPHFRRWVMAQTFDILEYDGSMEEFIRHRKGGYYYQFEQTLDELKTVAKMPNGTAKNKRSVFFTKDVVVSLCEDYLSHLRKYVENLPTKNHRGVPYKKVKGFGVGVHCKDIEGIVFAPLEKPLMAIKEMDWKPDAKMLAYHFERFVNHMIKIDLWNAKLCKSWVSAYKGAGAYYTLMGLIKFHDCRVFEHSGCYYNPVKTRLNLDASINAVEDKVNSINRYCWNKDWYLLYGMMKEVIKDNEFDFRKKMKEIYGK